VGTEPPWGTLALQAGEEISLLRLFLIRLGVSSNAFLTISASFIAC
jgi:hypothetical protein